MKTIKRIEIREHRVRLDAPEYVAGVSDRAVRTPDDVNAAARVLIGDESQEVFLVFLLDVRNKIVGYVEAHRGGIDTCPVDQRVVFRAAVVVGAAGVIIAHNHPSGDATPSSADDAITERLRRAGLVLGVAVLDHVVVTDSGSYSYRAHGRILK